MSDAIKELHDYLAKSPSVVYPEDVLAYLPAIEAENAKLRERAVNLLNAVVAKSNELFDLLCENEKLRELCKAWRRFSYELFDECLGFPELNDEFMALDDRMRELEIEV